MTKKKFTNYNTKEGTNNGNDDVLSTGGKVKGAFVSDTQERFELW